ncbi:MAG: hypothetical protein JXR96_24390 [Deltaproteobacteria bacterium]|nr:hypothetical protein [Deltaproteobacteria bacterium]
MTEAGARSPQRAIARWIATLFSAQPIVGKISLGLALAAAAILLMALVSFALNLGGLDFSLIVFLLYLFVSPALLLLGLLSGLVRVLAKPRSYLPLGCNFALGLPYSLYLLWLIRSGAMRWGG